VALLTLLVAWELGQGNGNRPFPWLFNSARGAANVEPTDPCSDHH